MADEEIIVVKSSSSDRSPNSSLVTEQRLLARTRREEARIAKAAVTRRVAHLEARIDEARRATSNTGSTVRAEGAEGDGGSSAVHEVTRSSACADPLLVFTGAELLSTMRAELPFRSWTTPTKVNLLDLEQADSGLLVRAGDEARSSNDTGVIPIVQLFTSSTVIQSNVTNKGFVFDFVENQRLQKQPRMLSTPSSKRLT